MTQDSMFTAPGSSIHRHPEPLTASVDGEIVMLDAERGAYFALGGVGTRIWEMLEVPHTLEELCRALQDEYAVDPETCHEEVVRFIEDLHQAQLVQLAA